MSDPDNVAAFPLWLPPGLRMERQAVLTDLHRLWLRCSDLRLGQLLGCRGVPAQLGDDATLDVVDDGQLTQFVARQLSVTPERLVPPGPYWDGSRRHGSFVHGRPRNPARIPELLHAIASRNVAEPQLSLLQTVEFALGGAGRLALSLHREDWELIRLLSNVNHTPNWEEEPR